MRIKLTPQEVALLNARVTGDIDTVREIEEAMSKPPDKISKVFEKVKKIKEAKIPAQLSLF